MNKPTSAELVAANDAAHRAWMDALQRGDPAAPGLGILAQDADSALTAFIASPHPAAPRDEEHLIEDWLVATDAWQVARRGGHANIAVLRKATDAAERALAAHLDAGFDEIRAAKLSKGAG